ncbi:hypothetical protein [Streptomyces sp. NPDC058206]
MPSTIWSGAISFGLVTSLNHGDNRSRTLLGRLSLHARSIGKVT